MVEKIVPVVSVANTLDIVKFHLIRRNNRFSRCFKLTISYVICWFNKATETIYKEFCTRNSRRKSGATDKIFNFGEPWIKPNDNNLIEKS